jgi:hypothetical protein
VLVSATRVGDDPDVPVVRVGWATAPERVLTGPTCPPPPSASGNGFAVSIAFVAGAGSGCATPGTASAFVICGNVEHEAVIRNGMEGADR